MKEYRVMEAANSGAAEKLMNEMAQQGWEVKCTTFYQKWSWRLVITFEREAR